MGQNGKKKSFQDGEKNVYKKQHVWACTYVHGNILHLLCTWYMKWCKNWDLCWHYSKLPAENVCFCATLYWAKVTLTLFTSMYIINPKDTTKCECDIVPIVKNSNI